MAKFVPAVCPCCGAGCGLYLECEDQKLVTTAPCRADEVSEGRLCVRGWQVGDMVRSSNRIGSPRAKDARASWDEALGTAAEILRPLIDGPDSRIGVLVAGHITNEEGYAIARFARDVLHTQNIDNFGRAVDAPTIWGLEFHTGKPYQRPPLREIADCDLIISLSSSLGHLNAQACSWITKAQQQGTKIAVIDEMDDGLGRAADIFVQHAPGATSAVLQRLAETLSTAYGAKVSTDLPELGPTGLVPNFTELLDMINEARRIAIVIPTRAFTTPFAGLVADEVARQLNFRTGVTATIFAVNGTPNSVGLQHMGLVPHAPDNISEIGLSLHDMLDLAKHNLDGLIVIGEELTGHLDQEGLQELRGMLKALICFDSFKSVTGEVANVTLPIMGYGEREGSFTTLDSKIRWSGSAAGPYGQSRYLPEVLADLASRLEAEPGPANIEEIWHDIAENIPGYNKISLDELRENYEAAINLQAIASNQEASLDDREYYSPIEVAEPEKWNYTLIARPDTHWWIHDGRMWALPLLYREMRDWRAAHVKMNPEDMKREGFRPGRPIILRTSTGRAELIAYAAANVPEGLIVLPSHQEYLMRTLLGPVRYYRPSLSAAYRPTPARVRKG